MPVGSNFVVMLKECVSWLRSRTPISEPEIDNFEHELTLLADLLDSLQPEITEVALEDLFNRNKTMPKAVFVFGSNEAGIHGAGAAKTAYQKHGARYGKGYGHEGNSFAIPTKDGDLGVLDLGMINAYVCGFLAYATGKRKLKFMVTRIGCGLAGYTDAQIAPLFVGAPLNCMFDEKWKPYLGEQYSYFSHAE